MDEEAFNFDASLKQAAEDYDLDFSAVESGEISCIVDKKDSYRDSVVEKIFKAVKQLAEEEKNSESTTTISLGFVLEDGGPKWELDWIIRMIELGMLDELCKKGILDYEEKTRLFAEDPSYDEAIAVITSVPQAFLDWYGGQIFGVKSMGNFMAYHRELAFAMNSVTAAIYYLKIFEWYWHNDEQKDFDGYIAKSRSDIEQATSLTISEQKSAKAILEEDGWLDVLKFKHGINIDRFKPLKPITIDRKAAFALRQASRNRSEKICYFDELYAELEAAEMSISENPMGELQKYENKATGELPAMDAKGKSYFSKHGDDRWKRKGFERFSDDYELERGYAQYKAEVKHKHELEDKIKKLREELLKR